MTIPRRPARSQWPPVGTQGKAHRLGTACLGVAARCLGRIWRRGRARLGSRTLPAWGRRGRCHRLHGRRGAEKRQYNLAPAALKMNDHRLRLGIVGNQRVRLLVFLRRSLMGDRFQRQPGRGFLGIGVDHRDSHGIVAVEAARADVDFLGMLPVAVLDDRAAKNRPRGGDLGHRAQRFLNDQVVVGVTVPAQADENIARLGRGKPCEQGVGFRPASSSRRVLARRSA